MLNNPRRSFHDLEVFLRRLIYSSDKSWTQRLWILFLIIFTVCGFIGIIAVFFSALH